MPSEFIDLLRYVFIFIGSFTVVVMGIAGYVFYRIFKEAKPWPSKPKHRRL